MSASLHKISTLQNGAKIVTRTMEDTESVTVSFFFGRGRPLREYEDRIWCGAFPRALAI